MSDRYGPPNHKDPKAKAGLTKRRERLGLPVGKIKPGEEPGR